MIAGDDTDAEFAHLPRKTAKDDMVHIVKLHTKSAAHFFGNHSG
jgi:hypothetical protein